MSHTSVLTKDAPESIAVDCEFNIIILGMLARAYGTGSPNTPMRSWGSAEPNRSIMWEGKTYAASPNRHKGRPGIRLTVRDEPTDNVIFDKWLPYTELDRVFLTLNFENIT